MAAKCAFFVLRYGIIYTVQASPHKQLSCYLDALRTHILFTIPLTIEGRASSRDPATDTYLLALSGDNSQEKSYIMTVCSFKHYVLLSVPIPKQIKYEEATSRQDCLKKLPNRAQIRVPYRHLRRQNKSNSQSRLYTLNPASTTNSQLLA